MHPYAICIHMQYPISSNNVQEQLNLSCSHHLRFHPVCPCRLQATSTELPPTPSLLRQMERGCVVQCFKRGQIDPTCHSVEAVWSFRGLASALLTLGDMVVTATKCCNPKEGCGLPHSSLQQPTGANMAQQRSPAKNHQQYNPSSLLLFLSLVQFYIKLKHIRFHALPCDSNKKHVYPLVI